MKIALPESVWSAADLKFLTFEARKYARYYRHYSVKATISQHQPIDEPPVILPSAADLINQVLKDAPDPKKVLDELIEQLSNLEAELPRISITLVAPASNKLKQKLVKWCRSELKEDLLVEFKYSSSLFGGLVIELGSHVYDWSWRRQILANLSHFPEVLRNV